MIDQVLSFWFEELEPAQWWRLDPEHDEHIRTRFGRTLIAARSCELCAWRDRPEGRLAEIIVLDQFSRNACRGTPEAFSADPLARALAQEAVGRGVHRTLDPRRLGFLYMPYMHSESAVIHDIAVRLFSAPGLSENLKAELGHKAIIDRFGRYPHRTAILGRTSTPEEEAFLEEPGLGAGFNGAPR